MDKAQINLHLSYIESSIAKIRALMADGGTPTPDPEPTPKPEVAPGRVALANMVASGVHVSGGAIKLGMEFERTGVEKYILSDVWTTEFGSWEPNSGDYSVPQWARDSYLSKLPMTGGDHHMYVLVLDRAGSPVRNTNISFFSRDGQTVTKQTNDKGFVEQEVYGSSSFVPERGEHGAWSFRPGNGETLHGFGMPSKRHVSIFGVWRALS